MILHTIFAASNYFKKNYMSEYEKVLRDRLKRDAIIGIGIISMLVMLYFASVTLL